MLYDTLLLIPLLMLSVALALGFQHWSGRADGEELAAWIVQSLAALCCVGFFAGFWLKGGQTLGMQAWRIKLAPLPGKELSLARAVARCAAALLSLACLGMGYLWCLVDRRQRTWHDYLSGTQLVLLPKHKKRGGVRRRGAEEAGRPGRRTAPAGSPHTSAENRTPGSPAPVDPERGETGHRASRR